jgi:para-nitrobenzyl esterase
VVSPATTERPAHGTEIVSVFGTPLDGGTAYASMTSPQKSLSQSMQKYWTNFARTGNPNGAGLPNWPRYQVLTGGRILDLAPGTSATIGRGAFGSAHQCGVWDPVSVVEPALLALLLLPMP